MDETPQGESKNMVGAGAEAPPAPQRARQRGRVGGALLTARSGLPQAGTAPHGEGTLCPGSFQEKRALGQGNIQLLGVPSLVSPYSGSLWGLIPGSPIVNVIIQCSHNGEEDG